MTSSIKKHLRFKIPYTHNLYFLAWMVINCIRQNKSESKIYINVLFLFRLEEKRLVRDEHGKRNGSLSSSAKQIFMNNSEKGTLFQF